MDVSTGQVSPDQKPAYGRSFQTPYADRIRHEAGIPVIAVGAISSYDDVNTIILAGRADLCALARPHLWDPHWTLHAAVDQGVDVPWPPQYRSGAREPQTGKDVRRMPLRRFDGGAGMRTVVVTGGKRGIGVAICEAFAGENVVALSSADMDVTDEAAVARVLGELEVDVLVNNAGISRSAPVLKTSLDQWHAPDGRQRDRRVPVHAGGARRDAASAAPGGS